LSGRNFFTGNWAIIAGSDSLPTLKNCKAQPKNALDCARPDTTMKMMPGITRALGPTQCPPYPNNRGAAWRHLAAALITVALGSCGGGQGRFESEPYDLDFAIPRTETFAAALSSYGLFQEPAASLVPVQPAVVYELASELFTDYARKQRLMRIPAGTQVTLRDDGTFQYPEGTLFAKTFYYPADMRTPDAGRRIIETRLLTKTSGQWNVATYLWNEEQTEATLLLEGADTPVMWIDDDGRNRSTDYAVPHEGACVTCHQSKDKATFIGPTPANLNRSVARDGTQVNQLRFLQAKGHFDSAIPVEPSGVPSYEDARKPLAQRARAYLDINCAHCHNPSAWSDASRRPLDFRYTTAFGATGLADEKNQIARLLRNGEMPYLGTTLLHDEGIQLVLEYLDSL